MKRKSRPIPTNYGGGSISGFDVYRSEVYPISPANGQHFIYQGSQITDSEGHPWKSRKGQIVDIGGEFYTKKSYLEPITGGGGFSVVVNSGGVERHRNYSGVMLPFNPGTVPLPGTLESSSQKINELGATAVARCKPTNSVADAATFLGELYKDRLPDLVGHALWRDKTITARNASEEFLNAQFGWQPLVSDVKSFAKAVSRADTVLAQYERDAGKVVRRRFNFPEQRTIEHNDFGTASPSWIGVFDSSLLQGNPSRPVQTVETVKRQWFAGAFTYALPSGYDSRNALQRYALMADKVYGASLTPDTLWELSPWSWAADWFSNTGDVVSNISSWMNDGLVMAYGYMMEHTIVKHTYTQAVTGYATDAPASPLVYVTETKSRRKANPFGFGVSWEGLSPVQAAIAAAIGFTR